MNDVRLRSTCVHNKNIVTKQLCATTIEMFALGCSMPRCTVNSFHFWKITKKLSFLFTAWACFCRCCVSSMEKNKANTNTHIHTCTNDQSMRVLSDSDNDATHPPSLSRRPHMGITIRTKASICLQMLFCPLIQHAFTATNTDRSHTDTPIKS